jgi:uncharacterized MAPEG superfamily protein
MMARWLILIYLTCFVEHVAQNESREEASDDPRRFAPDLFRRP